MEIIDLTGEWQLIRLADGSVRPMDVPGDIYSALIQSGELEDPYYGENELKAQWPGREDWKIERSFIIPEHFLQLKTIRLQAEVIDTIGEVYINGSLAGINSNMFIGFEANPKPLLHPGENFIAVIIRSPEQAAIREAARLPYPVPASLYPVSSPHRNLIRKAQCMAGWDWGPCLMTGGIYDSIRLIAADGPFIKYIQTRTKAIGPFPADGENRASGPDFSLDIFADIEVPEEMDIEAEFTLAGNDISSDYRQVSHYHLAAGTHRISAAMLVKKPKLWWPNGHGNPALYDLFLKTGSDPFFRLSHTMHKKIGFRELRVVSEEDDIGRSFKFVVNGKDIFAKGANWIPADALPSRWTRARIAGLLDSAVQAHMNCLRVWGGGRYESDDFYELCDERGIMIWQDCMFSCALYPSSPEFLSNVEAEITHQVKRLSDHPSIALWCGNNEALGAITWYEESKKNPARYIVDYDRLTEGVLGRIIRALDPDRCFWPSSPSAGPNDFSDNWHSDERGDMHFWSVWHEGKPFSEYLTVQPRFCSEFGFQAFPSMRTIESFAPPEERNISAPALEAHQKHPRGNSLILDTMLRYFRLPKGFRELVYLSQVQQAMAIRTAVEYWRSTMPRCMGTLYWQLNDVWPAVSWSSLNYDGTWKLLHYEARRFYAPVILALFIKDGAIQAHIISEIRGEHAATIILQLLDFHGEQRGLLFKDSVAITSNSSQRVWHMPVSELPCKPEEAYIEASLDIPDLGISTLSALFLTEPKRCNLADPGLEVTLAANANGQIEATVYASKAPAFYVALEIEGLVGQFEDAEFYCAQGTRKKVAFIQEERVETRNYASLAEQQLHAEAHAISQTNATLQARLRAFHLQNSFEH